MTLVGGVGPPPHTFITEHLDTFTDAFADYEKHFCCSEQQTPSDRVLLGRAKATEAAVGVLILDSAVNMWWVLKIHTIVTYFRGYLERQKRLLNVCLGLRT